MSVPRRRPVDSELVTPITRPEPSAARQAHWILYLGFIALPIIAGADKRDFGLSLGGLALARLSRALETEQDPPNSQLSVTPCAST
jgi:hypothetical protein